MEQHELFATVVTNNGATVEGPDPDKYHTDRALLTYIGVFSDTDGR